MIKPWLSPIALPETSRNHRHMIHTTRLKGIQRNETVISDNESVVITHHHESLRGGQMGVGERGRKPLYSNLSVFYMFGDGLTCGSLSSRSPILNRRIENCQCSLTRCVPSHMIIDLCVLLLGFFKVFSHYLQGNPSS